MGSLIKWGGEGNFKEILKSLKFLGIIIGDIVKMYRGIVENFEKILEEFRKIFKMWKTLEEILEQLF